MSRYKKAIFVEAELKDINGIQFIIYPTLETRLDVLNIYKNAQRQVEVVEDGQTKKIKGDFDINAVVKVCTAMIWEGCFDHDGNGKRTKLKDDEMNTTEEDIKFNVIENGVFEIYMEIATEIGVLSKENKEVINKKLEEERKKSLGEAS